MNSLPTFDPDVWLWAVLAVFVPYVQAYLQSSEWTAQRKRLFSVVLSVVLGIGVVTVESGWSSLNFSNLNELATSAVSIWALGQAAYHWLFKGTDLIEDAEASAPGLITLKRKIPEH